MVNKSKNSRQITFKHRAFIKIFKMKYTAGKILTKNGFEKGYIGSERKKIVEVGKTNPPKKPVAKGLICPLFINAHTHIGDSFVRNKNITLPKKLEELVEPPEGLKFKLLKEASEEEIIDGMEESINTMEKTGTKHFYEFREGGIKGICQLKTALSLWKTSATILSRPEELKYDKNEIDILLNNSDGIGLSSISEWNYSEIQKIAKEVEKKNKIFAIHASEKAREDIDLILDLKPSFLVHMIKATEQDLEVVNENSVPIVVCPRSNNFFGIKTDLELFEKSGVKVLIGTDNAMINSPSILDEIIFIKKKYNCYSVEDLLLMTTYSSRKALNHDSFILGPNSKAEFVVLDEKTLKPLYISVC